MVSIRYSPLRSHRDPHRYAMGKTPPLSAKLDTNDPLERFNAVIYYY
jgi:hypothetical protein